MNELESLIKAFPKVIPAYKYNNENSINPAYCDIEHCAPLCPDEQRIWVLRGDLILATGIKNAYLEFGYSNICDSFDASVRHCINIKDRYGHPSLAIPENDYDGSAYYAGWIRERSDSIEVYLCTGRYQNKTLNEFQIMATELYISMKFMAAFGKQSVVFYNFKSEQAFALFLSGQSLPSDKQNRTYLQSTIEFQTMFLLDVMNWLQNKHHLSETRQNQLFVMFTENINLLSMIVDQDKTPFLYFIFIKNTKTLIDKLIQQHPQWPGISQMIHPKFGWSLFDLIAATGQLDYYDQLKILVKDQSDWNSALILAVYFKNEDFCTQLLMDGANPAGTNIESEDPPLIIAATRGHTNICRLLVKFGANPDHKNAKGETARQCWSGTPETNPFIIRPFTRSRVRLGMFSSEEAPVKRTRIARDCPEPGNRVAPVSAA